MNARSIIAKYSLDQKTWTRKSFHGILHFFFPVGEQPLKPLKQYYGDAYQITVFAFQGTSGTWYWNNDDMVRLRTSFIKRVNRRPSYLLHHLQDWKKRLRAFDAVMRRVDSTDLRQLSNNQLLTLYRRWYRAYLSEYGISIGIEDAFSMHADDFLKPHFKALIPRNFEQRYAELMSPGTESFITQEYRDRLQLLQLHQQGKTAQFNRRLAVHAKKYHWLTNNYATDVCLTPEYFLTQIQGMQRIQPRKELRLLDTRLQKIATTKRSLIRKLRLDRESRHLVRITEVFAYIQDERKKYVLIASHYQNKFLNEVARRLPLTRTHAEFTFIHELPKLFRARRINTKVFDQRRECVLVVQTLKGCELITGRTATQIVDQMFEKPQENVKEFRGSIASTGKARGRVKIINKIHDLVNMEQGDILVAGMTRPEMVSAIRRAAAIVTDEGGITSHAAIVSREMSIPCIIGTKIATKVLRDGDMVEVDAERGIVRKLSLSRAKSRIQRGVGRIVVS